MLEYRKKYEINYQDVDYLGNLKLSHLLDAFSNIATSHAINLKVWDESLIDDYGWILSKMHIEINTPIKAGQYEVKTYPGVPSKVIFPRYYQLLCNDVPIVKASSIWTLLDLKKRRIIMPKRVGIEFPDVGDIEDLVDLPVETLEALPYVLKEKRKVRYSDVDTNQHMNNARYLEWVCDLLDYTVFVDHYISMIDIFFKQEIAPLSDVYLYCCQNEGTYYIKGVSNDLECFMVKLEISKK